MPDQPRIEINPKVMLGKPVIRGTRITVELISRKLGEGTTTEDQLDAYPHLTAEDIQTAMTYAADMIAQKRRRWFSRLRLCRVPQLERGMIGYTSEVLVGGQHCQVMAYA